MRFDAIFTFFFRCFIPVCAPTHSTWWTCSRILDKKDRSSLGLYVIRQWGAGASFHLRSSDILLFPPLIPSFYRVVDVLDIL